MKIWQVDPLNLTPYYDHAICEALAGIGHQVSWITSPSLYDPALPCPSAYTCLPLYHAGLASVSSWLRRGLRSVAYPAGHLRLLRALDRDPPDVVHFQWSRVAPLDLWLIRQIKRRGIPIVHTVHDVDPLFPWAFDGALAQVYAAADALIVHAEANRERLLTRYPALAAKTHLVRHIATSAYVPLNGTRDAARRCLHIASDAPVLLSFGSSRPYKGLELLVEAAAEARRLRSSLVLMIVGRAGSSRTRAQLKALPNTAFVRQEYIPSNEVWLYHRAADVAVFPYRRVSQSGSLITAMGFGLPVIVTNVGGLPETVDGNGWVVPANNVPALAEAIAGAFVDRERLARMGRQSLAILRNHHSPEKIALETTAVYVEAIGHCVAFQGRRRQSLWAGVD